MSYPKDFILSPGWLGQSTPTACIIGLGLIGGSWAGALYNLGWKVFAIDPDNDALIKAKVSGWVVEGMSQIPEIIDADLIILALPIDKMDAIVEEIISAIKPGTVVTDVASVKNFLHSKSSELLKNGSCFIGGHPMTGSEKSGFAESRSNLFEGFPYVLISDSECPQIALIHLTNLVKQTGAHVVLRNAMSHDLDVAFVSHLPHIIAVALTLCIEREDGDCTTLDLAGRSFREMTRIAESSPEMWQEILIRNRKAVLESLDALENKLNILRQNILLENGEEIADSFRRACNLRNLLNRDGGR